MPKRIIVFHTLNDFSGGPNVLSSVIRGLISRGFIIDLYTSSSEAGYLSGISGVNYHRVSYCFTRNRIATLIRFIIAQLRYFFISLQYIGNKYIIFYINTIHPFGAALAARLINKKVIYHVHENPVRKNIIHKIAIAVFLKCAQRAIFVSEYLYNSYRIDVNRKILVYNALNPDFTKIAANHRPVLEKPYNILMACSLKFYKGIDVFTELAAKLPEYHFFLVLNADNSEISKYFQRKILPQNLEIFPATNELHPFYKKSNLVVNLSLPDLFIESFGLTVLEGMTYGIPVIVPPEGGITELVEDGINGYKVDPADQVSLIKKINMIFSDEEKYVLLSSNAGLMAKRFSYTGMIDKIELVLRKF
jgi:glycosyltransferase involved in cell wall biosynthesis